MNKPSPDTHHVLIVQAWEWARGFAAASTGTGNFHCICVKLRSSLKEKVNICADLGTIQETIRGFPNGMWSEQPTCQVLNHPRGCGTETGECRGCCAGGLGPFQTQLLEQPACSTQVHGGVFPLQTYARRSLVCRMLRSSGATLPGLACPEVLGEKASTPYFSLKNLGDRNKLGFLRICCCSVLGAQKANQTSRDLDLYYVKARFSPCSPMTRSGRANVRRLQVRDATKL